MIFSFFEEVFPFFNQIDQIFRQSLEAPSTRGSEAVPTKVGHLVIWWQVIPLSPALNWKELDLVNLVIQQRKRDCRTLHLYSSRSWKVDWT